MELSASEHRLRNTSVLQPEQNGVSLLKPMVKVRFIEPGEHLRERSAGESARTSTKIRDQGASPGCEEQPRNRQRWRERCAP